MESVAPRAVFVGAPLLFALFAGCATSGRAGPAPESKALAAANPFEDCEITGPSPGARFIQCDGVFAQVMDTEREGSPPEQALTLMLEGFKGTYQGQIRSEKAEVRVLGVERPALRFHGESGAGAAQRGVEGVFTSVEPSPGRLRLLSCMVLDGQAKAERCTAILEASARVLPDANAKASVEDRAAMAEAPPTFAGRALSVPEGCHGRTGGIRCEAGDLSWRALNGDEGPGLDWAVGPARERLRQQAEVTDAAVSCRIDGAKAECRALDFTTPKEGVKVRVLFGRAEVRGVPVLLECTQVGSAPGLRPPCDQVLSLPESLP